MSLPTFWKQSSDPSTLLSRHSQSRTQSRRASRGLSVAVLGTSLLVFSCVTSWLSDCGTPTHAYLHNLDAHGGLPESDRHERDAYSHQVMQKGSLKISKKAGHSNSVLADGLDSTAAFVDDLDVHGGILGARQVVKYEGKSIWLWLAQKIGICAILAIAATTAFAACEVVALAAFAAKTGNMTSPVHQCLVRVSPTLSHPALVKVSSTAVAASSQQLTTISSCELMAARETCCPDDLESAMLVRLKGETTKCSTLPSVSTCSTLTSLGSSPWLS